MSVSTVSTAPAHHATTRSALIDVLKVLGSQLIVLHHFSLYGPIGESAAVAMPQLMGFIELHGRLAVQLFLVIGGFLAARSLSGRPRPVAQGLLRRYLRLAPLLVVALMLVLAATALLPADADPDWVSPWPDAWTWLAHLLLLQDIVGIPSLSAGAWYVAIDFQLFALLTLAAAVDARRHRAAWEGATPWLVAAMALASLWHFNRQASMDAWALYFMSSYGLGVLAAWAARSPRCLALFLAVCAVHAVDGLLDPRPRLWLALATAMLLWWAADRRWTVAAGVARALAFWSDAAYAVFVSHFAVIVALTAAWWHGGLAGPAQGVALLLAGWLLCLALGAVLHLGVENRVAAAGWGSSRPKRA